MNLAEYNQIIAGAIKSEEEAYLFYQDVAEKISDSKLKPIFLDLAKDEQGHKVFLTDFLTGAVKKLNIDASADYKVSESVEKPKLSTSMKPAEAMALAMKNEEEAMNLYNQLAGLSTDAEQKDLFLNLAIMEQGHKAKIEDMYVNTSFGEVW